MVSKNYLSMREKYMKIGKLKVDDIDYKNGKAKGVVP
jgi:hypothetical protein